MTDTPTTIAFEGDRRLAAGSLADVAVTVRKLAGKGTHENILVFDLATGKTLNLDLTGAEMRDAAAIAGAVDTFGGIDGLLVASGMLGLARVRALFPRCARRPPAARCSAIST